MLKAILRTLSEREDLLLRVAVAFPMIWAGVAQLTNPTNWVGFVPVWLASIVDPEAFLGIHSLFNLIVGAGILLGFWRIIFAGLATALLASILIFYEGGIFLGIDDVTFRDVGLTIVAFVLFLRALKSHWQFNVIKHTP
ncbi:MAG: hypothetical protein HYS88_01535 [Candidatus Colwellbacteria bacterium]|nr:hypothetical protein [Candidatus Colwellbacteria bacterium]